MAVADFARFLKASMGLDAASIGAPAIERAVHERAAACGVAGPDAYWQRVSASPAELQELIEAVVVPETWFFRDREAFSKLVRLAKDRSWATDTGHVHRILSLPCSTGEEPYSIAMALFDVGIPADRFSIDALDISAQAIALARLGLYGRNSFRGRELGFRSRYFEAVGKAAATRHQLADRVRRQVQFRQGNLLRDVAPDPARYDVIFCRNLLIYFDRPTQERAVRALERQLAPDGVVLVAPSETGVLLTHGLAGRQKAEKPPLRQVRVAASPAPRARVPVVPVVPPAPAVFVPAVAIPTLDEAAELANQGRFEDAINRCEHHLARMGPSADVFHLMGLVLDASGKPAEAVRCYRKALYLDPNHDEVLLHLTLLLEKAGNTAEAQLLRKRTQRLQQATASKNASKNAVKNAPTA